MNSYVNIQYDGPKFEIILDQFTQQTGCSFAYNSNIIPSQRTFHCKIINTQALKALRDILHQNGLDYELTNSQIIIIKPWLPNKENKQFVIYGRVLHKGSGERLVKASIQLPSLNQFTYSDEFGIFRLPVNPGTLPKNCKTIPFVVQFPGYSTYIDSLDPRRDYNLQIDLSPDFELLQNTLIIANKEVPKNFVNWGQSDYFYLNALGLKNLPSLLGEVDVMRTLSLQPGVVSGSEGMLGMYVRGGSADQNLVMLDEVPVFNAYHLYGIFGTFNGDIVKSAQMHRGSFAPEYGSRLSSVVTVQMIDGNKETIQGSATIGMLSSKFMAQGPIWKNRTTFSLAMRRSNFDLLANIVSNALPKINTQINIYNFWDINAKINHRFSEKSTLSVMIYGGNDKASFVDKQAGFTQSDEYFQKKEQGNNWGNRLGSIRWQYMPNKKTRLTAKAHITDYSFNQINDYRLKIEYKTDSFKNVNDFSRYRLKNGLKDIDVSSKVDIQANRFLAIRLGAGFTQHTFTPGDRTLETKIDSIQKTYQFNDNKILTPEIYSHAQIEYHNKKWGYADFGARLTYFGLGEKQYYIRPEPRFNYRYKIQSNWWVKASASQNIQFFHQLNNLAMGLPSDLWVPSNAKFAPSKARQGSLGTTYQSKSYQFSTEIFFKRFYDLLEYKDNAVYVSSALNWEKTVTRGTGFAKGWEMLLEKTQGKFTGWASYTLMYNYRQFSELNNGNLFPSRYDRRHNLYLVGSYKISPKINLSGTWTYNSGFAYTLPIGVYQSPTPNDPYAEIYIYGNRNNARSKDNHRLDLSAQYSVKKEYFTHLFTLGVYNCYNRKNPFFINLGYYTNGKRSLYQISLLPILPHVNYQILF